MRRRIAGLAMVVAVGGAACGVRLQDEPQPIQRRDVPFGLLERTQPGKRVSFVLYFLSSDRLIAVARQRPGPLTAELVVNALLQGPSPEEAAAGLRSAIPVGTTLLELSTGDDTTTVDLSMQVGTASDLSGVVRQLESTLGGLLDGGRIRVTIEGRDLVVPEGTTADGPGG